MVKVYIHGRPQGQDIWSVVPVTNDKFYLNPFLDSKIGETMDSVLQIDVWQNNSYYSYIHRKNILEKGNRAGAYFAITICFEKQLCTQVALLYNLLDSAYKQLCVNNLVEVIGEHERFLISQFSEKENVLNQISTVILQNINKYILSTLKPVSTNIDTTKTQHKSYANVDVDSPQFFSDCTSNRVLVSPSIVSKDKLPLELKQKISIIETEKSKLAEDRNNWQSKAEHERAENKRLVDDNGQLQEQIAILQKQVATIKEEQKQVFEKQIRDLQKSIEEQKQQNVKLSKALEEEKSQKQELQKELNRSKQVQNSIEQELKSKQKKKESKNDSTRNDSLPAITSSNASLEEFIPSMNIQDLLHNIKQELRRMAGRFPVAEKYVVIGSTLLNSILLIIVCVFLFMGIKKTDTPNNIKGYSQARIDIPEISNGETLKVDSTYSLILKNVSNAENYTWEVEGVGKITNENTFVVKDSGEVVISCIDSFNKVVKQRKIVAEK